ncbi:MAG: hypothetical protein AAB513_03430 [Patescibacteria group bacterium]
MKEILSHMNPKGKDEIILAVIIIFLGLGSFGLGRLSVKEEQKEPVFITDSLNLSDEATSFANFGEAAGDRVVGSKNGTVYHLPWCPGALKIKPENLITFKNAEEAEKAGYTKAFNCKGL